MAKLLRGMRGVFDFTRAPCLWVNSECWFTCTLYKQKKVSRGWTWVFWHCLVNRMLKKSKFFKPILQCIFWTSPCNINRLWKIYDDDRLWKRLKTNLNYSSIYFQCILYTLLLYLWNSVWSDLKWIAMWAWVPTVPRQVGMNSQLGGYAGLWYWAFSAVSQSLYSLNY